MTTSMVNLGNSSHRPSAYFEWWYFHFVAEDETVINLVLHETDIFGLQQRPYLSLSVLMPGQSPRYLRREITDLAIARQQPTLQVGEGVISETGQTIAFSIPFPGQGFFQGKITKLAPPLAIAGGILYQEATTERASYWVAQVPHATFTAILSLNDAIQRLTGLAYHDHQWGALLLHEFISDWVWGQFSNSQAAVIFFQILTQQGQRIERAGLVMQDGQYTGTTLRTNYVDTLFTHPSPDQFQGTIHVSFFNEQVQLSFDVLPAKQMRSRLNEKHGLMVASYGRWAAAAEYRTGSLAQAM
jgi:hypothetical protein